jgi:hypothetical protein
MSSKMKKSTSAKAAQRKGQSAVQISGDQTTGRVNIRSLINHPIFGGKLSSNSSTIPAAFVNILGNSTYFTEGRKVMMPELGLDPVNIVGCQPFSDVTGAVATPDAWTNNTLATASTANVIYLSPDTCNGPLAAKANLYDKFVFRDILLEYVSTCATSQASALAMCITEDGSGLGGPTSFSTVRQVVPSVAFPLRADRAYLHYHYAGPQLWWNAADTASNASGRLTFQGAVYGYTSANITVIVPGFVNIYYSVDLYDPVLSQGFTVSVKRDERDVIRDVLKNIREMPEKERDSALADIASRFGSVETGAVVVAASKNVPSPPYRR